jgi:hypothetical protein
MLFNLKLTKTQKNKYILYFRKVMADNIVYINPHNAHHFGLSPQVTPSQIAVVHQDGVLLYSDTYQLTGRETFIPPNGGKMVAFLCHVPAHEHWVHSEECSLLKYIYDPWYVCTALLLTNTSPYALIVPQHCDIYTICQLTSVSIITVREAEFFAYFDN